MIDVFIADDHSIIQEGLRYLLEAQDDIRVVGCAADGREAVRAVLKVEPDVVVMDIAMPGLNGTEATLEIHLARPETQILMLSMHSTAEHIFRALQAGARGYLLKESAGSEVVDAVRTVHAGRRYLSHKIAETLVDDYIRERHASSPLDSLSARERQILQLIVEGRSNAEAARVLFLSPKTVETYRSRMMQKLGITEVSSLVKFAIQHGLTSLE
jgi:DNA-binding NarL/FixJ family response regulator